MKQDRSAATDATAPVETLIETLQAAAIDLIDSAKLFAVADALQTGNRAVAMRARAETLRELADRIAVFEGSPKAQIRHLTPAESEAVTWIAERL